MSEHYFSDDPDTPPQWREISIPLAGKERKLITANGIFSSDGLDKATKILLATVPAPPETGNFLDIGCGWGPIALTLGLSSPAAKVWAVDVNNRALAAMQANAERLGLSDTISAVRPEELPPECSFDVIWSNPPIRIGKEALHTILLQWLPRLVPGGQAWLVVGKQLGADSLQKWLAETLGSGFSVYRNSADKGFRIIVVERLAS